MASRFRKGFLVLPARPVLKRELLTLLRTKRAFAMAAAIVALTTFFTGALWPEGSSFDPNLSKEMLSALALLLLSAGYLFIPGLAAVALTVERERETYELLSLTLLRPQSAIMAKLFNVLGFYYLLFVAVLPLLASVFFLVGVDWTQIGGAFAVIASAIFACAAAGLLCSALFRSSLGAILASYGAMVFLTGAPWLLLITLLDALGHMITTHFFNTWVLPTAPAVLADETVRSTFNPIHVSEGVACQLIIGLLCLRQANRLAFRAPKLRAAKNEAIIDDLNLLEQRRRRFPYYLIDPLRRKPPIEDGRNPVLVKEFRWGVFGKQTRMVRAFYSLFLLCAFVCAATSYLSLASYSRFNESVLFFPGFLFFLTIVLVPAFTANVLTKEYELSNMDLLRATLLTPNQIVWGKVGGALLALTPLISAQLITAVAFAAYLVIAKRYIEFRVLLMGMGTLGACTLLSLGLSVFSSVITRRTAASVVTSYLLTALVYGGNCLLAMVVAFGWMERGPDHRFRQAVAFFFSPVVAYFAGAGNINSSTHTLQKEFLYWFANAETFGCLGLCLIFVCVAVFRRYRMQDQ